MSLLLLSASCADILGLQEAGSLAHPGDAQPDEAGAGTAGASTSGDGGAGTLASAGGGADDASAGTGMAGATDKLEHGLTALSISDGVLEPAFEAEHSKYTIRVGVGVAELKVKPVAVTSTDTIRVNDEDVRSGTFSHPIALALAGETTISVTPAGTPESKGYKLVVERASGLSAEAYVKAFNARADDHFGTSVALSQGTLAVGAPLEDGSGFGVDSDPAPNAGENTGAVYVFTKSDAGWTPQAYLKASNPSASNLFGSAVALSGDVLAVGAPFERSAARGVDGEMDSTSSSSGAVYVFQRVAGHWAQRAYLKASDSSFRLQFGTSVAISGDTIVVGAPGHLQPTALDSAGAAYLFDRVGETWVERQQLTAAHPAANDWFGASVAISGGRVVVGAPGERSLASGINPGPVSGSDAFVGAAFIFDRSGDEWTLTSYLKASEARVRDRFGTAVAVDDGLVAVGAPGESSGNAGVDAQQNDISAPDSGAVYLFANTGRKSWAQTAYIKASNPEPLDSFGSAIALWQGVLAVSASGLYYGQVDASDYGEDSDATGINGVQSNNAAEQSGSAYLFAQASGKWAQQAYVKASNTEKNDHFGSAVALADGDLAVGAAFEQSSKIDDPSDNGASASGAVYVRSLLALPPADGAGAIGLSQLELSGLSFDFSRTTFDYQVEAPAELANISITTVAADPGAEIVATDWLGEAIDVSKPVALTPGDNRFTLHVAASSGEYASYSLDVLRPLPVSELLASPSPFDVSSGMLWEYSLDSSLPVAVSGDTLVVGVPYDDVAANGSSDEGATRDTGAVYVFVRTKQGWQKQAYLKASNAAFDNHFGTAVALDGDTLVVGAAGEASPAQEVNGDEAQSPISNAQTGAAYVFVRTAGTWQQQAYLKAFNASAYAYFGESVAINGSRVVVGARGESALATGVNDTPKPNGAGSSGAAYVFLGDASGDWQLEAYLKATNTREGQFFGSRVAILDDTIAITATEEGGGSSTIDGDQQLIGGAYGTGAVYTFVYNIDTWQPEAYLKAPNYHVDVDFGRSLALGPDTLAVGATGDQSRARYVDGDEFDARGGNGVIFNLDNSLSGNGAVYVFERTAFPGPWHQAAYLKASNSDGEDAFGKSVSLSGDYLVVGAPGESSSSQSKPDDNTAQSSGAAYLFHRSASGWAQTSYVKPATPNPGVGFGCYVALDSARLAVGNCELQSPEPFDAKTFGKIGVFTF